MATPSDPRRFIVARRSVIDIIDAGLSFYRDRYQNIIVILLLIYAPYYLIKFGLFYFDWTSFERIFDAVDLFDRGAFTGSNLLLRLMDASVGALAAGVLTQLIFHLACENEVSLLSLFQETFKQSWTLIRLNIFFLTLIFAGILLCLLPGVWLYILSLFTTPVILWEKKKRFRPIWSRLRYLLRNDWPRAIGFTALSWLLLTILGISLTYLLTAVYGVVLEQVSWLSGVLPDFNILRLLSGVIISLLLLPMQSIFIVLFYFDICSRKEALDLEVFAGRLS